MIATAEPRPAIPATSQSYDYDLMGRVARQQQTVGSNSYMLSYGYNLGGQLTSETYPSGKVVSFDYNDAAELDSVASGAQTYANQFDYSSPQGLLKSVTFGNGTSQSFEYSNRLQLKNLTLAKGGTTLQRYEYKYGQVSASGTVDETKNNGQLGTTLTRHAERHGEDFVRPRPRLARRGGRGLFADDGRSHPEGG